MSCVIEVIVKRCIDSQAIRSNVNQNDHVSFGIHMLNVDIIPSRPPVACFKSIPFAIRPSVLGAMPDNFSLIIPTKRFWLGRDSTVQLVLGRIGISRMRDILEERGRDDNFDLGYGLLFMS